MTRSTGGCLCGEVRFQIEGPLDRRTHGHCSMCRRRHGAAFATDAGVSAKRFRSARGEALVRRYASSPGVTRTFRERCGSMLQWLSDAAADRVDVAVGTLGGDPGGRPWRRIHGVSEAPWSEIADHLPRLAESSSGASA